MANTTILERFNELTALAAVNAALNALSDLAKEPNSKRYNRSTALRRERWLQIASLAERQAQLVVEPTVRKPKRVKVVPAEPAVEPTVEASASA